MQRMIETAIDRLHAVEDGARIEREPLREFSMAVGAVSAVALLTFTIGPAVLRQALSALFVISRSLEAAAPVSHRGHARRRDRAEGRGPDHLGDARRLRRRRRRRSSCKKSGAESAYERVAMLKGENGTYEGLLFDLDDTSSTSSKPRACARRRSR